MEILYARHRTILYLVLIRLEEKSAIHGPDLVCGTIGSGLPYVGLWQVRVFGFGSSPTAAAGTNTSCRWVLAPACLSV